MTVESIVRLGRDAAERLMTDTVRVSRPSTAAVTDPVTGVVEYPSAAFYEGRGRVQARQLDSQEAGNGGQFFTVSDFTLQLPYDTDLEPGDVAEVLASETDPLMVGRVFSVESIPRKTHMTAVRASVEEVTP